MRDQRRYPSLGPGYRVRRHRPVRTAIVTALTIAALGAGGWSLYRLGLRHGGYHERLARATESHLRVELQALRDRINELSNRNTLLARARRIDENALSRLRDTIATSQQEVARLEEELAFYRNLVSPSEMQPGLHVRRVSMEGVAGQPRGFRYELVLTQVNGDDTYVRGRVDFEIEGRRRGAAMTVSYEDVTEDDGEIGHGFRFKYFQTLRGQIALPDEFEPMRLRLRVNPAGGRVDPVAETYPWSSLLSGGS